jgi:hypothetical protein
VPGLGTALDAFFTRALAERPGERFQTAREMGRAVARLRESTAPLMDSEDLASAVAGALEREPERSVPVMVLGGGAAPASGVLTRVTVADDGPVFSLEPTAGETVPEPRPARRSSRRWPTALLVAAPLVAAVVVQWARSRAAPPPQAAPVVSAAPVTPTPSAIPPQPAKAPAPSAVTKNEPRAVARTPEARAPLPPAATTSALAPSTEECRGSVHFYSTGGSWSVSGGPFPVQAPGRYSWPCGSYQLTATSRMDPARSVRVSTQVRDGSTSTHELR